MDEGKDGARHAQLQGCFLDFLSTLQPSSCRLHGAAARLQDNRSGLKPVATLVLRPRRCTRW